MRVHPSPDASRSRVPGVAAKPTGRSPRRGLVSRPLLVALLLGVMALATAFGERGLVRLVGLTRDLDALVGATARLAEENRRLAAEIASLRQNPRALEAAARRDLGLVAPDELVFEFPE